MAIKVEAVRTKMSVLGGLSMFKLMLERMGMNERLAACLPQYRIKTRTSASDKFESMVLGAIGGAESLRDMDVLARDPGFRATVEHANAGNTYGNFLGMFRLHHCGKLTSLLIDSALRLRRAMHGDKAPFTLFVDSTDHEQYGLQMEGVEFNYKNKRCLDSLEAFDQYGFTFWREVRSGSNFTSNGAPTAIRTIFGRIEADEKARRVGRDKKLSRFVCADSGLCNSDNMRASDECAAQFVFCMRENMYAPHLKTIKSWVPCKTVKARGGRACEVGHTIYWPDKYGKLVRIVAIRALKHNCRELLFHESRYDYYAWCTNIGSHEMGDEEIVLFYHKRGNAENFIREAKNGFDLHTFPCQALLANKVYGLIVAFAANLTRFAGFMLNKEHPHFARHVRFRMVNLAVQVVKHARDVTFRFSSHTAKEVKHWMNTITSAQMEFT